ncbi:MAG: hypothetical protein KIT36_01385 [Alphaproteobacteria bacterium]|nr:hypothetical protein [Alphaproteobacteria bacterium]
MLNDGAGAWVTPPRDAQWTAQTVISWKLSPQLIFPMGIEGPNLVVTGKPIDIANAFKILSKTSIFKSSSQIGH